MLIVSLTQSDITIQVFTNNGAMMLIVESIEDKYSRGCSIFSSAGAQLKALLCKVRVLFKPQLADNNCLCDL